MRQLMGFLGSASSNFLPPACVYSYLLVRRLAAIERTTDAVATIVRSVGESA